MLEVAKLLAARGILKASVALAAMRDRPLLRRLNVPAASAEGFLFPDTYRFDEGSSAEKVLGRMVARHFKVYVELRRQHPAAIKRLRRLLGWGHKEIVTLASIVEKETGQAAERPLIAAVFLNRLRLASFPSRLLQTDPTIIYGCTALLSRSPACQRFSGRIRRIHLTDKMNPYNTYAHVGLPPGPISNPGRGSLQAVLRPVPKTRYLYFVSRNDGTHYFSSTRARHERAVDYYQRGRGSPPPAMN